MKIEKVEKFVANSHDETEYVNWHEKFKTSIKSCISLKKFTELLNSNKRLG